MIICEFRKYYDLQKHNLFFLDVSKYFQDKNLFKYIVTKLDCMLMEKRIKALQINFQTLF